MSRRSNPWLICLALLALGWAQVFGMQRGYLCDCSGEQELTTSDHCHGPHDATCHDDEHESVPHGNDDHSSDEDTHEHVPYKEDVTANTHSSAQLAAPQPAVIVMDLLESFYAERLLLQSALFVHAPPWQVHEPNRSWPRVLSRTIVLRV